MNLIARVLHRGEATERLERWATRANRPEAVQRDPSMIEELDLRQESPKVVRVRRS